MTIHKEVATEYTAAEIKAYLDDKVLPRPEIRALFSSAVWHGNILEVKSPLGQGTLDVRDRLVVIHIELSILGGAAKGKIESKLDEMVKGIGSGR